MVNVGTRLGAHLIPLMWDSLYWVELIGLEHLENLMRSKKLKRFNGYAQWFYEQSRYERAASILERSLSFCQKWVKAEPVIMMGLLSNLILVYSQLNQGVQVGALCDRLIKVKRANHVTNSEEVAYLLINLGEYLDNVGKSAESRKLIFESMVMPQSNSFWE